MRSTKHLKNIWTKTSGLAALFLLVACGGSDSASTGSQASVSETPAKQCPANVSTNTVASGASSSRAIRTFQEDQQSTRFIVKAKTSNKTFAASAVEANHLRNDLIGIAAVDKVTAGTYTLEFNHNTSSKEVAKLLREADYDYVEPDFEVHTTAMPNDSSLAKQWAHKVVHSDEAWGFSSGSANVVVAVIDTGVDTSHQDLAANIWTNPHETLNGFDNDGNGLVGDVHGWNFVSNNNKVSADDNSTYHGTHVAGTIGAVGNNGIGISGHAQSVKLMPLKFLGQSGGGLVSNAVKAVDYAIAQKANIISNSWGSSARSQALSDAIDRARAAGILFVVAAGNNGANNDKTSFYPSNYKQDNIIRVAASDSSDKLASWSSYGQTSVDLAAPGVNIYSSKNGDSYQSLSGTSMATPLVSGVLATMVAMRPDLSYQQIKAALLQNVDKIASMNGKLLTNGRINAYKALASIQSSSPPTPEPTPSPEPSATPSPAPQQPDSSCQ